MSPSFHNIIASINIKETFIAANLKKKIGKLKSFMTEKNLQFVERAFVHFFKVSDTSFHRTGHTAAM
jgi:hypothetical protein